MVVLDGFKLDYEKPANFSLIMALVSVVLETYVPASRSPLLIGQYTDTKIGHLEHKDLIEEILWRISPMINTRLLLESDDVLGYRNDDLGEGMNDKEYFYRLYQKKNKAIWFIDSITSFQRLKSYIVVDRFHYERNGFFTIVYTGPDYYKALRIIFYHLYSIFVINVNVLVASNDMVYVYTYFPFSEKKCRNTEPHLYDFYGPITGFQFKKRRFFTKKLVNMWGCKLKVGTWTEPPFIIIRYNETSGDFLNLEGIEGYLMNILAERMNFSITVVSEPNNDRGMILDNGTITGATKMLVDGEINIFIVSLMYDKKRQEIAQPVISYLNVPLNLAIPKGKLMSPFERLIRPFKYIIWSCLSSSILTGILVIYTLKALTNHKVQEFVFGKGFRIPFTNLLSILFGGSIPGALPRRNFSRYLLAIWIFYCWVLRSTYMAQLFLILQDSRGRTSLYTIKELIMANYTFFTYPVLAPILQSITSSKANVQLIDKDISLYRLFKQLSVDDNANFAVTILRHFIRAYNRLPENKHRNVNILSESLLNSPLTFYVRKHSFLVFEMNDILINIISAGLINRFEDLYLNKYSDGDVQEPSLISLWLLLGLFSLYFALLILCTIVFLLELWSKRSPLTKRVIDFLNF